MVRLVTAYTATARQLQLPAWADPAGAPDGLGGVGEVQASHGGDLEAAELDPAAAVVAEGRRDANGLGVGHYVRLEPGRLAHREGLAVEGTGRMVHHPALAGHVPMVDEVAGRLWVVGG
jgi:hypothetical protein